MKGASQGSFVHQAAEAVNCVGDGALPYASQAFHLTVKPSCAGELGYSGDAEYLGV